MNNTFNLWIIASTDFGQELKALLKPGADENGDPIPPTPATTFPLLNGITDDTIATFKAAYDQRTVQALFKPYSAAGRDFKLYSFYAEKPDNVGGVIADFQALEDEYPLDFSVAGAWRTDTGARVGPFTSPAQLINLMPDVYDHDTESFSPATELTDVNLLAGQAPRDFTTA